MPAYSLDELRRVIEKHWGYRTLRPLQEGAMRAVLDGRDSLVVLPTGGGKSLCYQAPAVLQGGTTVVVSPLIALMKDQVDGLKTCGVAAVQLDSSLSSAERSACEQDIRQGNVRLLFVSPERMALDDFRGFLQRLDVRTFAIDEAHCISHWGHDFRPEYRQLNRLKEVFPKASVHAYTATATERVRRDICQQLRLNQPEVLVGNFDRPNLNYRILPKLDPETQVVQVLNRHPREAGIIYCIRRLDVDDLSFKLKKGGYNVMPYHAGMAPDERKAAQEAFASEQCDVIVATIAFGMGIDRSNIRFVMHTGMPKSIEHYQQETGRAGRDGLEAECVLLFSMADFMTWKFILEKSARENDAPPEFLAGAMSHLRDLQRYCESMTCRHKALVEYFGQKYEAPTCQACDVCLGDTEAVPDAVVVAQKILSCVARVEQRFGVKHVIDVLRGANTEKVRSLQHDRLSTHGLLRDVTQVEVRNWIYQLISQGVLVQEGDEYPVLKLNDASWEVLRKQRSVRLVQPARRVEEKPADSRAAAQSWEGVDRGLFEELRTLRQTLARQERLPPYVIFNDRTLRELARARPSSLERMRAIHGVGERKLRDWGEAFVGAMMRYCQGMALPMDQFPVSGRRSRDDAHDGNLPYESLGTGFKPDQETAFVPPPRTEEAADSQDIARKILSCVARMKGPYRATHAVRVLRGTSSDAIRRLEHDKLSTFGLLRQYSPDQVRDWISQLIEKEVLAGDGEYNPRLTLNEASWQLLRNERQVVLMQAPGQRAAEAPEPDADFWEGVNMGLFEALSLERTRLAADRKVAPTAVVQDFVLREMARARPSSLDRMRSLSGVSDTKVADVGSHFLGVIALYCEKNKLNRDAALPSRTVTLAPQYAARPGTPPHRAFNLFREGAAIEDVMADTQKSYHTVNNYLRDFILREKPASISRWVPDDLYQRIADTVRQHGNERLKPIYLALGEQVPYEPISLVVAHLAVTEKASAETEKEE